MARRYLHMSPSEWDGLAWWEQEMYLDGYGWEGLIESGQGATSHTTTVFSGQPGEMTAQGFTEMTI